MEDFNKNFAIAILSLLLVFFVVVYIIDNYTGRKFRDGVEKAEIHHMITGKYYNEYIILDKDSSFIKIEKEASFDEMYFTEIDGITIIEN